MRHLDTSDIDDAAGDAADTLRFTRLDLDAEAPSDPDATSIYDLRAAEAPPLRAVIAVSEEIPYTVERYS